MTDILVGNKIAAADFPPTVGAADNTDINNIADTSFVTGSPEVAVTFIAPTSGKALIINGGGCRNNTGTDQVFLGVEVRQTNGSGTIVYSPTINGRDTLNCADQSTSHEYKSRCMVLSGLTPGGTYYARIQYRTRDGDSTADISSRSIIVQPIP